MQKAKLGKSNHYVSRIGLGTVQFGLDYGFTPKKTQTEVDAILNCAIKNDINLIDTAREYGDSERKIGNFLTSHDADFIIATKLKKISEIESKGKILTESVISSIETSLTEMRLSRLDILQLHQTDEFLISNPVLWDTIDSLKRDKTIGGFGISVYEVGDVLPLLEPYGHLIDFFQVPFNIFDRRFEILSEILSKHEISIVGRSTFLKGVIPCLISDLPLGLEGLIPYKMNLEKKAKGLGLSVRELAVAFVYCSNFCGPMLLGVNDSAELEENIKTINELDCASLAREDFLNVLVQDNVLIDPRKWSGF